MEKPGSKCTWYVPNATILNSGEISLNQTRGIFSIDLVSKVKKLGYERWLIYKQPRQYLDLSGYSFPRYQEKCSTQIYRALYGNAMLVPKYERT